MRTLLNNSYSTQYQQFLGGMNQQLATIATGIADLPSNIAKSLANVGTSPSTTFDPSPIESKPRISKLLPQLDRKNFQNVVHWEQTLYNRLRKKAKSAEEDDESDTEDTTPGTSATSSDSSGKKVSTLSCYMEDENGVVFRRSQQDAARAKAKGYWIKLWNKGQAPPSHGHLDIDINEEYIAIMEDTFPWLRYCENHWKSEQIWRNHYSNWYSGKLTDEKEKAEKAAKEKAEKEKAEKEKAEKEKAAKEAAEGEVIDVDADSSHTQGESSKRRQVDGETSKPKRRRVEEVESTPPRPVEEAQSTPPRPVATKITTERLRVRLVILLTMIH